LAKREEHFMEVILEKTGGEGRTTPLRKGPAGERGRYRSA